MNGGTQPPPLPTVDRLAQNLHFLKLYRGREAVHAMAVVTGANGEQRVEYRPVHRALTDDDLRQHLDGSKVLGVYPIREDSTCLFGAIDVDAEDQQDLGLAQTRELHAAAMRLGFPDVGMVVSFSGRKGHHLDCFFAEPIPAGTVRLFLEAVITEAGFNTDDLEVFPKQDAIDPAVPTSLGNLVKLPLAKHPLTGRKADIVVSPNQVMPATAQVVYQILSALPARAAASQEREARGPAQEIYIKGHRTKRIEQLAGILNAEGVHLAEAELACQRENEEHCSPPLDRKKVAETVEGIYSRYPDQHRQGPAARELHPETQTRQSKGPSQATELAHLAEERYEFISDHKGRPFAVPRGGPYVARPLRGGKLSLRAELAAGYVEHHGSVPRDGALADAMRALEGKAGRVTRELNLRVARYGPGVIYDLGRPDGQVVVVRPNSWSIEGGFAEVVFERSELTQELPIPERGGDLSELRALLNVTDADWPLLVAWMIAVFFPGVSRPILLFKGESGTAKTYAARLLLRLVDPSSSEVNGPPHDLENFAISCVGSQVVVFDNLRRLDDWLSDALCRASTGEGIKRRTLYTDQAISVITFKRCLMLTGINVGGIGDDLRERLLTAELAFIPDDHRLLEEEVNERFRAAHSRLLGALLDLLCKVLAELPRVQLAGLPRMADFARILAALDRGTDWQGFERYDSTRDDALVELLEGDVVAQAVIRLVDEQTQLRDSVVADGYDLWDGTATQLLSDLERVHPTARSNKLWPTQPNHLSGRLTRLAPALRRIKGIDIQSGREGGGRARRIRITRFERPARADGADDQSQAISAGPPPKGATRPPAPIPTPPPLPVGQPEADEDAEWRR